MDHSFGSAEEVDHVRILQSCNAVYLYWPLILENQVTTKWYKLEAKLDGRFGQVFGVCLGEGENDAFVVINLSTKVVKNNLISNTNTEIFDIGSNQMDDDDDDAVLFIPPFEVDPNIYEFILSLASV
nr:hypothetical protein [Tanacetum cinerariifolium]